MAVGLPPSDQAAGYTEPAMQGFAITPAVATDLPHPTRGIYVGTTGDLSVLLVKDQSIYPDGSNTLVLFKNLAAGVIHPIAAARVSSVATTATDLIGVY